MIVLRSLPWIGAFVSAALGYPGGLEVGQAYLAATADAKGWQSFRFFNDFPDVPVVIVMPGTNDTDTGTVRLRNVSSRGFEASFAEPSTTDGVHSAEFFNYIAASPGIWDANGSTFEVGRLEVNERVSATCRPLDFPSFSWKEVTFQHNFSEIPAFLAYIQTSDGENRTLPSEAPSEPWLVVGVNYLSESSVQIALDSNAAFTATHIDVPETIGYIAWSNVTVGTLQVPNDQTNSAELFADAFRCDGNTWLDVYSASTQGCMREILEQSSCSQDFFNYGSTSGQCGCVQVNADCTQSSVADSSSQVFRIMNTSAMSYTSMTYSAMSGIGLSSDMDFPTVSSGSWPSVMLNDVGTNSPLIIGSMMTRIGNDGSWPRLNFETVSASSVQFMNDETGGVEATFLENQHV